MPDQEVRPSPKLFYGYIVVLAAFILAVVAEGLMYSFGIFFEPLLTEFGWTRALTASAFSLYGILHLILAAVAGRLSDKFGARPVLTISGFFMGLGYLLMSRVNTVGQIYLFYGVFISIGMGFYWVPMVSTVTRWFVQRRALILGIVASGIGVGVTIMSPLANWLISAYGWRNAYLIMGGAGMGILMIFAQFLRRSPEEMGLLPYGASKERQEHPIVEARGLSLGEAIHTRRFWMISLMFCSWVFSLSTVMTHIVINARGLGLSAANAANVMAIIGVTGIIGRISFGRLSDVIGMKPAIVFSLVLMAGGFVWLMFAREMWSLYLFAFIFGLSYGTVEILQSSAIADLFGLKSLGAITGLALTISGTGFMLGPVVAGYIFDVRGSYQVAFLICALLLVVSIISVMSLPLTKGGRKIGGLAAKNI